MKIVWFGPAWTPIFLPLRSASVRIGLPSSRDTMQKGFFWKVLPMILSGAPCSLISVAVESGADETDVDLPRDDGRLGVGRSG